MTRSISLSGGVSVTPLFRGGANDRLVRTRPARWATGSVIDEDIDASRFALLKSDARRVRSGRAAMPPLDRRPRSVLAAKVQLKDHRDSRPSVCHGKAVGVRELACPGELPRPIVRVEWRDGSVLDRLKRTRRPDRELEPSTGVHRKVDLAVLSLGNHDWLARRHIVGQQVPVNERRRLSSRVRIIRDESILTGAQSSWYFPSDLLVTGLGTTLPPVF